MLPAAGVVAHGHRSVTGRAAAAALSGFKVRRLPPGGTVDSRHLLTAHQMAARSGLRRRTVAGGRGTARRTGSGGALGRRPTCVALTARLDRGARHATRVIDPRLTEADGQMILLESVVERPSAGLAGASAT